MPIGLKTLPMVTPKARASRRGLAGMECFRARMSITGVPTTASVSFISTAESIPAPESIISRSASGEHDLPDLELESPDLPHRGQQENCPERKDGKQI